MVIVLTLVTPLLVVLTYQWAPRRVQREPIQREPDQLVQIALASAEESAAGPFSLSRSAARLEVDLQHLGDGVPSRASLAGQEQSRPVLWYRVAAAEQGVSPYLLEALHQIESSAAPDGCLSNVEGSGAVGPFQFKRSTFEAYAVDGNGDGVIDICGFADSLFSAAAYLKSLGVDGDLDGPAVREALLRYGTDADRVIELARYYRSRDLALTAEASVIH
jgi:transglycosylase-like protein with SLT domain